jgi:hypothetical protein
MVASYRANADAFVPGKPRLWAANEALGPYFDLAPDGKRFAMVEPEASNQKGPQQVTFLMNFFDELRRKVPVGK